VKTVVPEITPQQDRRGFLRTLLGIAATGGSALAVPATDSEYSPRLDDTFILNEYARRSFRYFVEQSDPVTGLVFDRASADGSVPGGRVASVAATGFGLTALCLGVERGWITPADARERVMSVLRFLNRVAPQVHGFYLHFMEPSTGEPRLHSEFSSIDTALLLAGVLTAGQYFSGHREVGALAQQIYDRTDFTWMLAGNPTLLSHGYRPGQGFLPYRWDKYNEASVLYLLAIGSNTHAIPSGSWYTWKRPRVRYKDWSFISGGPLFTHQFSHAWVDFRDIHDARGMNFFRNSIVATYAHRDFCLSLRDRFANFGPDLWGITASDSPGGYLAWGGPPIEGPINGTIVPCASTGSLMLAPEICMPVLREMLSRFGDSVYGRYGFADAFNPQWQGGGLWVDPDVVGIDVGISLLSIDNLQNGHTWNWFMQIPSIKRAMGGVGFRRGPGNPVPGLSQLMAQAQMRQ
jgi:hypothetical protein